MKKIFSIVAVAAALVLVGCAHKQPEVAPVVEQQQEVCKGKHCKHHQGKFGHENHCKKDIKK